MVRLILDANVIISAIGGGGPPRRVFNTCIVGKNVLLESPALLEELARVLLRPKFDFIPGEQKIEFIKNLIVISKLVRPSMRISVVSEDLSDNKVLECALEGKADLIVSGDSHLLKLAEFSKIKIVDAANALSLI